MFQKKTSNTEVEIGTALAKADDALNERHKIEATSANTSVEMKTTEADLQRALERLSVEEAGIVLDDTAVSPATQRTVQNLRLRLEAQQARLRGLERRLVENEDQVRGAQDGLAVARDEWMRARVAEFRVEYMRAVTSVAGVLRKAVALGDALGADELSAAARNARLYDPADLTCSVVDMEPTRIHASGMIEHYPVWEDDPAAKSVHDALVHVRLKAEMLDRVGNEIRHRRDETAREEQRRLHDAARPRTVAFEVHYPPEYSAVAPVEVIEAGKRR
jgi:hypothetical protein